MNSMQGATGKIPGFNISQIQNFSPEMMDLFRFLMSQIGEGSFLGRLAGGESGAFEQLEAPALKQFSGLQGELASRFSGMGTGARRSSGFQNTASQAASDFAQQLLSNRMNLQNQALRDLQSFGSSLLGQRPTETVVTPEQMPFWKQLLLGLSPGLGSFAGSLFGQRGQTGAT